MNGVGSREHSPERFTTLPPLDEPLKVDETEMLLTFQRSQQKMKDEMKCTIAKVCICAAILIASIVMATLTGGGGLFISGAIAAGIFTCFYSGDLYLQSKEMKTDEVCRATLSQLRPYFLHAELSECEY